MRAASRAAAEETDNWPGSSRSCWPVASIPRGIGRGAGARRGVRQREFPYVALRLLLDLEWEVITLARRPGRQPGVPLVSPVQLHGIEINAYAYELAQRPSGSATSSGGATTASASRRSRS